MEHKGARPWLWVSHEVTPTAGVPLALAVVNPSPDSYCYRLNGEIDLSVGIEWVSEAHWLARPGGPEGEYISSDVARSAGIMVPDVSFTVSGHSIGAMQFLPPIPLKTGLYRVRHSLQVDASYLYKEFWVQDDDVRQAAPDLVRRQDSGYLSINPAIVPEGHSLRIRIGVVSPRVVATRLGLLRLTQWYGHRWTEVRSAMLDEYSQIGSFGDFVGLPPLAAGRFRLTWEDNNGIRYEGDLWAMRLDWPPVA